MKIKTSTLAGQALDWAVAKCEGLQRDDPEVEIYIFRKNYSNGFLHYSTDWSQGGPIIERMFRAGLQLSQGGPKAGNQRAWARLRGGKYYCHESSPLIAAMRCYVASKFDDKVEIPNELI